VYLISLGVLVFLTMAGASALMQGVAQTAVSERSRDQLAALHLAEAGVDQAAINLRTPTDTLDDITTRTLAAGAFQVDTPMDSLDSLTWKVTTRGSSVYDPGLERGVEVVFALTPQSIFQYALFGEQGVSVSGHAETDSYDSRLGAYDENTNSGYEGDVGTNVTTFGGITVGGSIFVDGQAVVGPDVADPISVVSSSCGPSQPECINAFITGGTSPPSDDQDVVSSSEPFPFPPVTVPAGLTCGDLTIAGGTQELLSPDGGPLGNGSYCYHSLTVEGNAQLTPTGPVDVYLTGQLIARGNSSIGDPSNPKALLFLMTSSTEGATLEEGSLTGSTKFYGALYGPDAIIDIKGNAEVFGSIVAETVTVSGSAVIHYDEALTEMTDLSNLYTASVASWREL